MLAATCADPLADISRLEKSFLSSCSLLFLRTCVRVQLCHANVGSGLPQQPWGCHCCVHCTYIQVLNVWQASVTVPDDLFFSGFYIHFQSLYQLFVSF